MKNKNFVLLHAESSGTYYQGNFTAFKMFTYFSWSQTFLI